MNFLGNFRRRIIVFYIHFKSGLYSNLCQVLLFNHIELCKFLSKCRFYWRVDCKKICNSRFIKSYPSVGNSIHWHSDSWMEKRAKVPFFWGHVLFLMNFEAKKNWLMTSHQTGGGVIFRSIIEVKISRSKNYGPFVYINNILYIRGVCTVMSVRLWHFKDGGS